MANKKELIDKLQEVGHDSGLTGVKKFLDDNGIDVDGLQLRFLVKDISKIPWKPKTQFVKVFDKEIAKMDKNIITVEMLGLLTLLTPYLNFEDNSLMKDDKYINQNDIMEITGWGRKKVNQTLKVLIDHEIIYTQKQKEDLRKLKYSINPNYFYRGQKIDPEIKEYYKDK